MEKLHVKHCMGAAQAVLAVDQHLMRSKSGQSETSLLISMMLAGSTATLLFLRCSMLALLRGVSPCVPLGGPPSSCRRSS